MSTKEPSTLAHRPQAQASQQLPLPLEPLPSPSRPGHPASTITPRQVWVTLTPLLQVQVRQVLVRIIQESLGHEQQ
jgi:hypothetical protein